MRLTPGPKSVLGIINAHFCVKDNVDRVYASTNYAKRLGHLQKGQKSP